MRKRPPSSHLLAQMEGMILTVVSLVDYLIKNKDVMKEEDKD